MFVGNTCYEDDIFIGLKGEKIGLGDLAFLYPVGAYYYTTKRSLHDICFPKEKVI